VVVITADAVSSSAAMPSVALGLRLIDVNAPSRISPTPAAAAG